MLKTLLGAAAALAIVAAVPVTAIAQTVGIAMPTKSSTRWISDGESMEAQFQAAGYDTILQYAEDDIPTQLSQVENMLVRGVDALVIAAIDGTTLSNVLEQAASMDVVVVAYDRLIRDSGDVDYYTTFDNFKVGQQQAQTLLDVLDLDAGPYNIELFGGSPDDNNAFFFYNGAMDVLQPHIDSGVLNVKSGQTGMDIVGTLRWSGEVAQARMDNLLSAHYTDDQIHAVLSPYDGLSIGIISSLKGVGYGSGDLPMPAISGQDAEIPSLKAMMAGEQTSTIFKDTRELAGVTVALVDDVLAGREPTINDTETYENGVKIVPSFLLEPMPVTVDNIKEAVIDSGYYTEDQLK
ncbi:MAG: multiple monosaccharide ABC transporter substrate-binding protein [Pseudomonadota bacterium]